MRQNVSRTISPNCSRTSPAPPPSQPAPATARRPDRSSWRWARGSSTPPASVSAWSSGALPLTGRKPGKAQEALQRYRDEFRPSSWFTEPYVIASATVAIGDTTEAARSLLLPEAWAMVASRTIGDFPPLEPARTIRARTLTPRQRTMLEENLAAAIHGTAGEVEAGLTRLLGATDADEVLITTNTFDSAALTDNDHRLAEVFGL